MKTIIIILVISATVLYIPIGIVFSKGLQIEDIVIEYNNSEKSIKVAHISDLHYPQNGVDANIILDKVKATKPDLVFLTGDILDSQASLEDVNLLQPFITGLSKISKVYAVTGNHELDFKEFKSYKAILKENNITLLQNSVAQTEIKGIKLAIAGIDDNNQYGIADMELDKLQPNIPILLLSHRPDTWEDHLSSTKDRKPIITFSGHAHGGQIRLFGKGVLSHGSGLFPKYSNGLYKKDNSFLVVSRGLGNSDFPLRVYNKYHLPMVTIYI